MGTSVRARQQRGGGQRANSCRADVAAANELGPEVVHLVHVNVVLEEEFVNERE